MCPFSGEQLFVLIQFTTQWHLFFLIYHFIFYPGFPDSPAKTLPQMRESWV